MTLLNIANDGYYNVLIAICRALVVEGPIEKNKLIESCSNKTDEARKRLRQTLLRWTQLGLFVDDDGNIDLCRKAKECNRGRKDADKFSQGLPKLLREIIFLDENNENFWDKENTKSADLSRGLSWLLSQDIYNFSFANIRDIQELESRQVTNIDQRIVQNDVRLNGLKTWAQYLGFIWQSKEAMIDPTVAISQELPDSFPSNKPYPVEDFLKSLRVRLPVLDGGQYRRMVEDTLDPQEWRRPARAEVLSTSLSRAIWRLELKGLIRLESRADPKSIGVLQRADGEELKSFTHVIFAGGSN